MLCQACSDLINWKSVRWKGSYKATFDSGEGSGQPTSTDSTTLDPEPGWEARIFYPSKPGGFVHHLSGRAFLAAAHEGCQLCLRLDFQLSPKHRLAITEEPEDIDITSADYDYVVGYGVFYYRKRGEWYYQWHYSPRTLNDIVGTGGIYLNLIFYPSKGVLRQSSRWLRSLN